jgi:hypothetical protein
MSTRNAPEPSDDPTLLFSRQGPPKTVGGWSDCSGDPTSHTGDCGALSCSGGCRCCSGRTGLKTDRRRSFCVSTLRGVVAAAACRACSDCCGKGSCPSCAAILRYTADTQTLLAVPCCLPEGVVASGPRFSNSTKGVLHVCQK